MTPRIPYVLNITATGSLKGFDVNVFNRTTGERIIVQTTQPTKAVVDLANMTTNFTNGDVIEVTGGNGYTGGTTITVDTGKGGASAALTIAAYTAPTSTISM